MTMTPSKTLSAPVETPDTKLSFKNIAMSRTSGGGGMLVLQSFGEVVAFAEVASRSQHAIPAHLRGNPGACMAVVMLAMRLDIDFFALASKSYNVKDIIAYEAQVFAAIVNTRAPIKRRPDYVFSGVGDKLVCTVSVDMLDGSTKVYRSPEIGRIPTKNSPLWKGDPEQQLGYYSIRAWARRYCPDVILGIYTPEEVQASPDMARPAQGGGTPAATAPRGLQNKLDALANAPTRSEKVFTQDPTGAVEGDIIDHATTEPANDDTATSGPDYEPLLASLEEDFGGCETEAEADAVMVHAGWVQDAPQEIVKRAGDLHTEEVERIKLQASRDAEPDPHADLKDLARRKAGGGRQVYNRWFSSKSDDDRKIINPMADELSQIAAEADRQAGRA